MKAFLDTHVAVMLWNGDEFTPRAREILERAALFVSPMVRLELSFLEEIGRLTRSGDEILGGLASELGVTASEDAIRDVVAEAMGLDWTRDPFDRLLVATAKLHRAPFVTRDERILQHYSEAVW